ncbi:MAG: FecR domain-containing protein [Alphaproteobacteria bacterium]|nr:FecR domain-containing protein [Alphaproteobacteria bacterium]
MATAAPWIEARADTKVGVTAAVNPQAIGQPPTEPERVLMVGTDTFANEKITTGPAGQVQLLFTDGSSLALGPNADVKIDEFVYDPNTKTGKLAISATQGLMRLVGGAISKSSEVTVTTPSMTAGIRGGVMNIDSRPGQPAHAHFLFGIAMRVTAAGVTQEATRPGFGITVAGPGQPPQAPVRLTTAEVSGAMGQTQASSRQAATGGATQGGGEALEDTALAASNVSSATGSNQAPASLSQVGGITTTYNQTFNANTINAIQQAQGSASTQIDRGAAAVQATPFASTGTGSLSLFGRFYSDQLYLSNSFNPQNGTALLNPNNNAAITFRVTGSGNNRSITFTLPVGSGGSQQFTLPFNLGPNYSPAPLRLNGGGTASGLVQVESDASFFVVFGSFTPAPGNDCGNGRTTGCKFALFGGLPTTSLPTSGFSSYQLQTFDNSYPFLGRNGLPGGTTSPMFVAWSPITNPTLAAGNGQRATFMQASIWISGTATNQQYGMLGTTGAFFKESNSTIAAAAGMVGQVRDCASCNTIRYGSGVSSAQIVTGAGLGNAVYGTNGQYIVFVPDQITPVAGGEDTRATGATVESSYDTLAATQNNNGPNFFLTVARNPGAVVSGASAARTTQTLNGYVGGISERRNPNATFSSDPFGTPFSGGLSGPSTVISTDAGTNKLSANFIATNFQTGGTYNLVFGNPPGALGARGSFINDLIFASRDAMDTNGNSLSTANGSTVAFNRLFMVPNSVAQINLSSFAGPINQCTCAFMQWGWWIGEVQPSTSSNLRERFTLATWVAGQLSSPSQIAGLGGASVTYVGHAVGNVAQAGGVGNGGFNYVAAGNFQLNWSFGSNSGSVFINNWDRGGTFGPNGVNLSGGGSSSNVRDFSGTISGSGLTGQIAGSFYQNGSIAAAGTGGNFIFSGTNYKAAGIFIGQR